VRFLIGLPVLGLGWWGLGFPPGGWLVTPLDPQMPVTWGELIVLGTVVLGMFGALAWLRNNL
jgi:hypothetical protein